MRSSLVLAAVLATSAFAQPGAWTGYVGGWKYDPPPPVGLFPRLVSPRLAPEQAPARRDGWLRGQLVPQVVAVPVVGPFSDPTVAAQREALQREQDALAQQQRDAALALQERERRLAEEQAAAQRELLAQQQRLAEQQRAAQALAAAQEALAEKERAQAREAQAALAEQERNDREARLREREEKARAEPRTPGPTIHHWVDADGVQHYSTNPPPGH